MLALLVLLAFESDASKPWDKLSRSALPWLRTSCTLPSPMLVFLVLLAFKTDHEWLCNKLSHLRFYLVVYVSVRSLRKIRMLLVLLAFETDHE